MHGRSPCNTSLNCGLPKLAHLKFLVRRTGRNCQNKLWLVFLFSSSAIFFHHRETVKAHTFYRGITAPPRVMIHHQARGLKS